MCEDASVPTNQSSSGPALPTTRNSGQSSGRDALMHGGIVESTRVYARLPTAQARCKYDADMMCLLIVAAAFATVDAFGLDLFILVASAHTRAAPAATASWFVYARSRAVSATTACNRDVSSKCRHQNSTPALHVFVPFPFPFCTRFVQTRSMCIKWRPVLSPRSTGGEVRSAIQSQCLQTGTSSPSVQFVTVNFI